MLLYGSNGLKFAGASRHSTLGCSRLTLEEQKLIGGGGNKGERVAAPRLDYDAVGGMSAVTPRRLYTSRQLSGSKANS